MRYRRITIVNIRRPPETSVNEELQWFAHALGLFGERDRDRSCYRIFLELIKALKMSGGLSSDELADRLGLTRATVVHHLNTLMDRGIVTHHGNAYMLRADTLSGLVDDLQRDMERYLLDLRKTAEELDRVLRL